MKKIILAGVVCLLCFFCTSVNAQQSYDQSIGLRAGYGLGLSYKKFIKESAAVEGVVRYRNYGAGSFSYYYLGLTAMYQVHNDLSNVTPGLAWYYGGGVSVFSYGGDGYDGGSFDFGLVGALGLDYKFANFPINVSVDWLPAFIIGGDFGGAEGGLAVRYTF